jgi:hypothetical protein
MPRAQERRLLAIRIVDDLQHHGLPRPGGLVLPGAHGREREQYRIS